MTNPPDPTPEITEATPEERNFAVLSHLCGFSGLLIPFANLIAPAVLWYVKRDESDFIGDHAREALNFQISMSVWGIVAGLLTYVLIGFLLLPVVAVVWAVCMVIAALAASRGEEYRYPFTLRLVS